MAESRIDTPEAIGRRVALIRRAYSALQKRPKEMGISEFARLCDVGIQALHNVETGKNRIGVDNAIAICRRTGASLDYVFFGDPSNLAHGLGVEIEKLDKANPVVKTAERRSRR